MLYENDALVIVSKPPGVSFHSEFEPGALARLRASRDAREERLRAVHRLDKGTSGALVFAKTADAAKKLARWVRDAGDRQVLRRRLGEKAEEEDGDGDGGHGASAAKGVQADEHEG